MKIVQSWKRNTPTTKGYSMTITCTCFSKNEEELEELAKKLPKGTIVIDTEDKRRADDEHTR